MALNSQKMNLDYIRTFVVLGQSRNMTQASQKLNVTISYISRHLRQLEEELEVKLIISSPQNRELELTESGKYYFEKYEKIYNELLLAEKNFKQMKNLNECKINIGVNEDLEDVFLSKKLKKFLTKYNNISVKVFHGDNRYLSQLLNQFRIDFMIYKSESSLNILNDNVQTTLIEQSDYCFVYNTDLYSFKDFASSTFILPFNGTEDRISANNYFKEHNINPKVIYEFSNFNQIISYVQQGFGIGFVLKSCIKDYPNLHTINVHTSLDIRISYIKEMLIPSTKELLKLFPVDL